MDCERCEERLLDYLYEELSPGAKREVEQALEECESCRSALERLQAGQAFALQMPMAEPPQALDAIIMKAAREKAEMVRSQSPEPVEAKVTAPREEEEERDPEAVEEPEDEESEEEDDPHYIDEVPEERGVPNGGDPVPAVSARADPDLDPGQPHHAHGDVQRVDPGEADDGR